MYSWMLKTLVQTGCAASIAPVAAAAGTGVVIGGTVAAVALAGGVVYVKATEPKKKRRK